MAKKERDFYIFSFLFFFILFCLSPISGDDWGNYIAGSNGLYHSIGNAVGMYFSWEGRFVSRILINVLTYHKFLWNIVNSLAIVLLFYLAIKIINPKRKRTIYLLLFSNNHLACWKYYLFFRNTFNVVILLHDI